MKINGRLTKSVFINSLLYAKVMYTVTISNKKLFNNNTSNMKIRESERYFLLFEKGI